MLKTISETLRKYANGWLVLILFAGEVFFNTVILPAQQAKIEVGCAGTGPIDLQLFYTPEKVYSMVESYGGYVMDKKLYAFLSTLPIISLHQILTLYTRSN